MPAHRAAADGAEAFVGGLLGGAIGSAIANQQQRRVVVQERRVVRQRAPQVNSYQREENRRVQTALNYFGFPAGTADGVLGRNSRAAIGQYQAYMGYPPTGVLTEYEKVFLISSYDRAIVGGAHTAQVIATNGQGLRGLWPSLLPVCLALVMLARQPDIGMAFVVAAVFGIQLFLAGLGWGWITAAAGAGITGLWGAYLFYPHFTQRVDGFMDPSQEVYQVDKAMNAVASGGLLGRGIIRFDLRIPGKMTVRLPEVPGDGNLTEPVSES